MNVASLRGDVVQKMASSEQVGMSETEIYQKKEIGNKYYY